MPLSKKGKHTTRLRKTKRKEHYMKLQDRIHEVHRSGEFWSTIKTYQNNNSETHDIKEKLWIEYYKEIQPKRVQDNSNYTTVYHPTLDYAFSPNELNKALKKLSKGKAAGPDGIKNEYLKKPTTKDQNMPSCCTQQHMEQ